jgi:oligopeptidase B
MRCAHDVGKLLPAALAMVLLGVLGCAPAGSPAAPRTKRLPHREVVHGRELVDDYRWLRDADDPDVVPHLEAENEYAEAALRHASKLRETLAEELRFRLDEEDVSLPAPLNGWLYYARTEPGQQYTIHCRKRGNLEAPEEVLLDENELSAGQDYFATSLLTVSPDGQRLAFVVDSDERDSATLLVKDLASGRLLADEVPEMVESVAWAADNRTLFYVLSDEASRPYQVFRHTLGEHPSEDVLVYEERDPHYHVSLALTNSERYLVVESHSNTAAEIRVLKADQPTGELRVVVPRVEGRDCYLDHQGDHFLLWTNGDAPNFRLLRASVADPAPENWTELVPHRDDVVLEGVQALARYTVLYERCAGRLSLRILPAEGGSERVVQCENPLATLLPDDNLDYDAEVFRYGCTSLLDPYTIYEVDLATGVSTERKREEVPGYRREDFVEERIVARAADGTEVPITLAYRRGLERNGDNPLVLYGYGAYGLSSDPEFASDRLSLLERGVIYAVAHVRGGGDLGRQWYEQGRLLNKPNSFSDFIACAEHLVAQGYTRPERMAAWGESAGGLLVGAVANQRPDLFRCVVAKVPFVDVLNTMLDEAIPLTVIEYEEWGDPADPAAFACMASYSPYDNVRPQAYPDLLITAGYRDPLVPYWEPAKWAARLRQQNTADTLVLLRTNLVGGHSGASGRYDALDELAWEYAFVLDRLGVQE